MRLTAWESRNGRAITLIKDLGGTPGICTQLWPQTQCVTLRKPFSLPIPQFPTCQEFYFPSTLLLPRWRKLQALRSVMLFSRREHGSLQGPLETRVEITITTMTIGNNILRTTKVIPSLLISGHIIPTENQSVTVTTWSH